MKTLFAGAPRRLPHGCLHARPAFQGLRDAGRGREPELRPSENDRLPACERPDRVRERARGSAGRARSQRPKGRPGRDRAPLRRRGEHRAELLLHELAVPEQPCHQGVWPAAAIKAKSTWIYSIGYDHDALNGGAEHVRDVGRQERESPTITAYSALQQIASGPDKFYDKPDLGQLKTIFTQVAADIRKGARP